MQIDLEKISALIEPILTERGWFLYHLEWKPSQGRSILNVILERKYRESERDGISLDELVEANHLISSLLDLEDPITTAYDLRVESPGIERVLVTHQHFSHAIGEYLKVILNGQSSHSKRVFENVRLLSVSLEGINIEEKTEEVFIPFSSIKNAKTVYQWVNEKKK